MLLWCLRSTALNQSFDVIANCWRQTPVFGHVAFDEFNRKLPVSQTCDPGSIPGGVTNQQRLSRLRKSEEPDFCGAVSTLLAAQAANLHRAGQPANSCIVLDLASIRLE